MILLLHSYIPPYISPTQRCSMQAICRQDAVDAKDYSIKGVRLKSTLTLLVLLLVHRELVSKLGPPRAKEDSHPKHLKPLLVTDQIATALRLKNGLLLLLFSDNLIPSISDRRQGLSIGMPVR